MHALLTFVSLVLMAVSALLPTSTPSDTKNDVPIQKDEVAVAQKPVVEATPQKAEEAIIPASLNDRQKGALKNAEEQIALTEEDRKYIRSLYAAIAKDRQEEAVFGTILLLKAQHLEKKYSEGFYDKQQMRADAEVFSKIMIPFHYNEASAHFEDITKDIYTSMLVLEMQNKGKDYNVVNFARYLWKSLIDGKILEMSNIDFIQVAMLFYPTEPGWNYNN